MEWSLNWLLIDDAGDIFYKVARFYSLNESEAMLLSSFPLITIIPCFSANLSTPVEKSISIFYFLFFLLSVGSGREQLGEISSTSKANG